MEKIKLYKRFVFGRGNWFISAGIGTIFFVFFLFCIPVFSLLFLLSAVITVVAGFCGFIKKDDSEIYDGHR